MARSFGVTEFVRHHRNQGLARSFTDGVNHALALGADIVVNTDGDNQYPQERIADLVQPILRGEADIVIADRQVGSIDALLAGEEGAPALRLAGGQRGRAHRAPRRRERLPRLLARER